MINVTLKDLQRSAEALGKLVQTKNVPLAACFRLARLVKTVEEHLLEAQAKHHELVKKHCQTPHPGAAQTEFKSPEDAEEYRRQIQSLEQEPIELLGQPFKICDFGIREEDFEKPEKNTLFTAHDLSLLDWLILLEEPGADADSNNDSRPAAKGKKGKSAA